MRHAVPKLVLAGALSSLAIPGSALAGQASLSPASGAPGSTVVVHGTGFPGSKRVTVKLTGRSAVQGQGLVGRLLHRARQGPERPSRVDHRHLAQRLAQGRQPLLRHARRRRPGRRGRLDERQAPAHHAGEHHRRPDDAHRRRRLQEGPDRPALGLRAEPQLQGQPQRQVQGAGLAARLAQGRELPRHAARDRRAPRRGRQGQGRDDPDHAHHADAGRRRDRGSRRRRRRSPVRPRRRPRSRR